MKGNFMKVHLTPDYLGYIEKSTKQLKEQLEEVKKLTKKAKEENLPPSFYIDSDKLFKMSIEIGQKVEEHLSYSIPIDDKLIKKANEMHQKEEQLKQTREKIKQNINYNKVLMKLFDTHHIESKLTTESVSEFFLSSSLHLTDQDFMLKNYNYDIENKRFTGLIKNERNNRTVYFIVNRTNNVDWLFHLVVLQDENEINKIPDYPTNEQDWIGLEYFESTLIDLLK